MTFYKCIKCGKVLEEIISKVNTTTCCGQSMFELKPNVEDASVEKHVPVIAINNNIIAVSVGETLHPMDEDHYIAFICVETTEGIYKKMLKPGSTPFAEFPLKIGEEVINVYAYCNVHGLWKKDGMK